MTADVTIRPMEPGEEPRVCALVARVFQEFVAHDFPPEGIEEFGRYARPQAMVERCRAGNQVLVAVEDQRIVGMLELKGLDHIALLFVEAPGRGLGGRLVARALEICGAGAAPGAGVTVHASRYAAPIYGKLGFAAQGPERTENGITYLPMVYRFRGGERRD